MMNAKKVQLDVGISYIDVLVHMLIILVKAEITETVKERSLVEILVAQTAAVHYVQSIPIDFALIKRGDWKSRRPFIGIRRLTIAFIGRYHLPGDLGFHGFESIVYAMYSRIIR